MKSSKRVKKRTFSVPPLPVSGIMLFSVFVLCIFLVRQIFAAGNNSFTITVCPHGLGICGDSINANTNTQVTKAPNHTTRTATLTLYANANNPTATIQGAVMYNTSAQNFQGTITNATAVPNGNYTVSLKADGFLTKQLPGSISVASGQTNTLSFGPLINGDINNDELLDIMDYNLLISCFGIKMTTASCLNPPTSQSPGADINDDGTIDGADYNLFLREFSVKTPTITPGTTPTSTPLITPTPTTMQATPTMKPITPTTKPTPTTVQGTITMTKTITQQGVTNVETMQMPVAGGNLTGTITQDCQGTITGTYTGAPNYMMTGSSPINCLIGGIVSFNGTNSFTGTVDPNTMTATINYTVTGPGVNQTGTEVFNYTVK